MEKKGHNLFLVLYNPQEPFHICWIVDPLREDQSFRAYANANNEETREV